MRNIVIHGNYYPYNKANDELTLLYNIDKAFIQELENTVSHYFRGNTILGSSPKNFGAEKGTISDISKIATKLNQSR